MELYLQNIFLVLSALCIICYTFPWDMLLIVPLAIIFVSLGVVFAPMMLRLKTLDNVTRSSYLSHFASSMDGLDIIHTFGQTQRFFEK